jgi:ligand-binding SRPBCC domain-containing protein
MKLYALERSQVIRASLADVWQFFSDPHNLARLTPPELNLVVPAETPHCIHPGMIITYPVRAIADIQWNWVTEITQVIDNQLFVDEQRFGPYRFWHHQHHFHETGEGIEVRDLVHYSLPLGPLGRLVHAMVVEARLSEIFDYRLDAIRAAFGQTGSKIHLGKEIQK